MLRQGLLHDVITYSALSSACGKGTQQQGALQIFEAMRPIDLLPDGIAYNALAAPARNDSSPQRALQFLEAMRHQGLLPDRIHTLP